ncbi:laminarinase [Mycena amicta]|nr:laminarinase [Mycena amicta]
MLFFLALLGLSPFRLAAGLNSTYHLTDNIVGEDFFSAFSFQNISDPTHSRVHVNYTDKGTALSQNLTFASQNTFVLRAESETVLAASGPGRNSVRLMSNKQVTTGSYSFDVQHMPQGCGTWPALWTVGADWPNQGEVDILEGVNDQGPNHSTLHTNAGCTMPPPSPARPQSGTSILDNCDVVATANSGCGVKSADPLSYGPAFNENGGGWYATEISEAYIQVWFWPRNAGETVPLDVRAGNTTVDTSAWGMPAAFFPALTCPISSKFGPQSIIINRGDWAGQPAIYASSGCPSTCIDYVNNNPAAFSEAYFELNSLRIFV